MKLYICLVLLWLLSCTSDKTSNFQETVQRDTLFQNGIRLVVIQKDNQLQSLVTLSGDTIVKAEDYYHQISFPDINKDGYNDIRVAVFSNTPNQCENYFFDPVSSRFHLIENADLDMEKLKNTDLYFSYNRAGCADLNWESHLSKIQGWEEMTIGRINAKGCGDKDDGIYIYKLKDSKEEFVEKISMDNMIQQNKVAFIKEYWERNYSSFY